MNNSFVISSGELQVRPGLNLLLKSETFSLYSEDNVFRSFNGNLIYIEGYVIPRNDCYDDYCQISDNYQLIDQLFRKHSLLFIEKVKGFFVIAIITQNNFYIWNDIHSVKRFFVYSHDRSFIISNNFSLVRSLTRTEIDPGFAAKHAIFQHFILGHTLYKDLKYSDYGTIARLEDENLVINKYWNTDSLIDINKRVSEDEFIYIFNKTIGSYLGYFNPGTVECTITGGRDTRSILAALIANKYSPHLFTFGSPENRDVIVGREIAEACSLSFSNPCVSSPVGDNYGKLVCEIAGFNNQFIHLHRAHRLDAIKKEASRSKIDMLFIGAMGGDYIKGTSFDDYIVSEFVRRFYFETQSEIRSILEDILTKHFILFDEEIVDEIENDLLEYTFFAGRVFNSKSDLYLTHDLVGCTHDIQDISVFSNFADKVIAPYMDIDIMEALFGTNSSLLYNSKNSRNLFTKYLGGSLQAKIVVDLCPVLAGIPYANYYKPTDLTGNIIEYITRRGIAYFKQRLHPGISGFEYGSWFETYIKNELVSIQMETICDYYDLKRMRQTLENETKLTHEGFWHRYTNPIIFSKYLHNNKLA